MHAEHLINTKYNALVKNSINCSEWPSKTSSTTRLMLVVSCTMEWKPKGFINPLYQPGCGIGVIRCWVDEKSSDMGLAKLKFRLSLAKCQTLNREFLFY